LFGVLVDGGVPVVTMSFEATLKAEDNLGKRRNYRQKGIGVIVFFFSALAFYGFQSIARVEEYEWIWCFVWYTDKGDAPKHANHGV
jgi:hypothetical protein